MNDAIVVISPRDLAETKALSKDLSTSGLMPQALRGKPQDLMAIVMAGAELRLAPMQAIRGIQIISGKISLSADLMGALVKSSPLCEYLVLAESTPEVATFKTKRKGDPEPTTLSFTIKQARTAGLTGGVNWTKYPDAMLRARCLSAICRAVYPDLCLGVYDPSEAEELAGEKDITPQVQHVERVREELRAVVDAEVVLPSPMADRIRDAGTQAELAALIPEIKALSEDDRKPLGPLFATRKQELTT